MLNEKRLSDGNGEVMMCKLLNIGYGNHVVANKIVAIIAPGSSPVKRLREEAKTAGKLIDATQGKKTRSLIITDNHIVLSGIDSDTLSKRFKELK